MHKTTSNHFILIVLFSTNTSEIQLIDAGFHDATPQVFLLHRKVHKYSLDHYQHQFYIPL